MEREGRIQVDLAYCGRIVVIKGIIGSGSSGISGVGMP